MQVIVIDRSAAENATLTIGAAQELRIKTRYAHLSHGSCWGKRFNSPRERDRSDGAFTWCAKAGEQVCVDGPGYYLIGSSDGFNRTDRFRLDVLQEQEST